LRRDRRTAMIVVAVMAIVMGLIIWLASMSSGSLPDGINYWQIMP
jgi:preprotein translocase subunit SecE